MEGLRVLEIFYSIQGEGPFCCRKAVFLRLAGCNLRCPFCDTKYSWRVTKPSDLHEVMREINSWRQEYHTNLIVVTGGEPLLQFEQWLELYRQFNHYASGHLLTWQFETNGTIYPLPDIKEIIHAELRRFYQELMNRVYFVVSPKDRPRRWAVPGAKLNEKWLIHALDYDNVAFKVLARDEEDIREIAKWAEGVTAPVYVMPLTVGEEMKNPAKLLEIHRKIGKLAYDYGLNFSPRAHLFLGLR